MAAFSLPGGSKTDTSCQRHADPTSQLRVRIVRRAAVRFRNPIFLFEPAFLEHVVEDFTIAKSAISNDHIKNFKYITFFESSVQQDWSRISEVAPALASVLDGLLRAHCVIEQFKETRSP